LERPLGGIPRIVCCRNKCANRNSYRPGNSSRRAEEPYHFLRFNTGMLCQSTILRNARTSANLCCNRNTPRFFYNCLHIKVSRYVLPSQSVLGTQLQELVLMVLLYQILAPNNDAFNKIPYRTTRSSPTTKMLLPMSSNTTFFKALTLLRNWYLARRLSYLRF
jgi:hypothetical protein